MPIKPKVDPKKQQAERLSEILKSLLTDDENKYCADCDAKQPRWAAWNLGVFLCIRCAGIHRNLGVHISRVKSVSLDTWLPEQVQSMRVMGNAKAKAVYEARIPEGFRRPQNDQALEMFIRAKYDQKKYILQNWSPPKVDVADLPSLTEPVQKLVAKKFVPLGGEIKGPAGGAPAKPPQKEDTLVDLFGGSAPAPAPSNDLFSLNSAPQPAQNQVKQESGDLDDLFGPIVSAPTASIPQQPAAQSRTDISDGLAGLNFGAPASTGPAPSKVDDIMSLFNKPVNVSAMNLAAQQTIIQNTTGIPQQSSFTPQPTAQPAFPAFGHPAQPSQSWANNWASTPTAQPIQPSPSLMTTSMPSFHQPAPAPKSQANAFDDLFAQAQTAFGQPTVTPSVIQHKPAATTAPISTAQNDLESLFM